MSAKRALFQTPTRSIKRRKTAAKNTKSTMMRIPKSLLPEMKNFIKANLTSSSTNYCYSQIPIDMTQGDGGNQFIGQKFRIARLRVNYDFTQVALQEAVRISVVIRKDPSGIPILTTAREQWDTSQFIVLHDMLLPDAAETAAGTFDVVGPLNVEMTADGTSAQKNNLSLYVHSASNGVTLLNDFSYQVWYTDS